MANGSLARIQAAMVALIVAECGDRNIPKSSVQVYDEETHQHGVEGSNINHVVAFEQYRIIINMRPGDPITDVQLFGF